jgi:hypothetical protein
MPIDRQRIRVCYLCGRSLDGKLSDDHVPPRQLYGKEVRKKHNPNLLTIPVHADCNHTYQHDEDYFVYSMSAFAVKTYSGKSVLTDINHRYKNSAQRKLLHKVFREWEKRPSGLHLPPGKVVKRIEGKRIHRVAWKIVRGLFFYNEERVLPESTPSSIEYVPPDTRPPDTFFVLNEQLNLGQYSGVFDYRYKQFPDVENMYYWAMLFWDAFLILMAFHDPDCGCKTCVRSRLPKTVTPNPGGKY